VLKKTVQYENFEGQQASETFYFHMSQAELLRWETELEPHGGLGQYFTTVMESGDGGKIMALMEDLIARAVGRKSPDGSRFEKTEEIRSDFRSSLAYDELFMGIVTDPEAAAEFLNGIVPKQLLKNVEKLSKLEEVKANVEARQQGEQSEPKPMEPPTEPVVDPAQGGNVFNIGEGPRHISEKEMREMDHDELVKGLAEGKLILDYRSE